MGWCSGTELFDKCVKAVLGETPVDKKQLVKDLIDAFEDMDWDCQSESDYIDHPIVNAAMRELHPDWDWE